MAAISETALTGFFAMRAPENFFCISATPEAATYGAELEKGQGPERIYIVEPTGRTMTTPIRRTRYARQSVRVLSNVQQAVRDGIEALRRQGNEADNGRPDQTSPCAFLEDAGD